MHAWDVGLHFIRLALANNHVTYQTLVFFHPYHCYKLVVKTVFVFYIVLSALIMTKGPSTNPQSGVVGLNAASKMLDPETLRQMPYSRVVILIHSNLPDIGYPITKSHVAGVFWLIMLSWTSLGAYGSALVCNFLAVVHPAWQSYISHRDGTNPSQWLAYWTICSLYFIVESGQMITSYFPFYYSLKLFIMLWCMYPGPNNGSEIIYKVLKPILAALDVVMSNNISIKTAGGKIRKISISEGSQADSNKQEKRKDNGKHK